MKIGIPRGLLFYRFYALWKTFLEELGQEVLVSPPTSKPIIQQGLTHAVEEVCFPAKVYLGHCHFLKDQVDMILIPRVVSFHRGEYNCPKILGLPDLTRSLFGIAPERMIDDEINMRERGIVGWRKGFFSIGQRFVTSERKIAKALEKAETAHRAYRDSLRQGILPETVIDGQPPLPDHAEKVLLLGHAYLASDSYINMNLIHRISGLGFSIITPDMLDQEGLRRHLPGRTKPSFWTMSNEILASALYVLREKPSAIKGFVHLMSFECGPDSLVGELVGRWLKRDKHFLPYLKLEIDEHTGEAGMLTRLEAFVDMMKWRHGSLESHLSASRPS
ncbi:MAG TPA: acyl-CoA dehydratase activase-related protein [Atribacteraceae bacterium]|nr:acyl-CoA dehydratase activase-related protein [Atribacteraceae bacterium]